MSVRVRARSTAEREAAEVKTELEERKTLLQFSATDFLLLTAPDCRVSWQQMYTHMPTLHAHDHIQLVFLPLTYHL